MLENWRPVSGPEDLQVGARFSYPSIWGDPNDPTNIVTEITEVRSDGIFLWKIVQPFSETNRPWVVGNFSSLEDRDGWIVQVPTTVIYQYDPTQQGDTDDDI